VRVRAISRGRKKGDLKREMKEMWKQ